MITFAFKEFEVELLALQKMSVGTGAAIHGRFVDPNTSWIFDQFREDLRQIAKAPAGDSYRWEIQREYPLRTELSMGRHEKGVEDPNPGDPAPGGPFDQMFAEITCLWEIAPLGEAGAGRRFMPSGVASTVVTLRSDSDQDEAPPLAMWRMEVGDQASPGSLFHVQIGELDREERPFPHALPVPRFPTPLLTPQGAIEFTLGELFQDAWPREAAASQVVTQWAPLQKQRLRASTEWLIAEAESGVTALAGWKSAKPTADDPLVL